MVGDVSVNNSKSFNYTPHPCQQTITRLNGESALQRLIWITDTEKDRKNV